MDGMTKPLDAPAPLAPPRDLAALFESAGLVVTLAVSRADGAPLTDDDRATVTTLVEAYSLDRDGPSTSGSASEREASRDPVAINAARALAGTPAFAPTDKVPDEETL